MNGCGGSEVQQPAEQLNHAPAVGTTAIDATESCVDDLSSHPVMSPSGASRWMWLDPLHWITAHAVLSMSIESVSPARGTSLTSRISGSLSPKPPQRKYHCWFPGGIPYA